MTLMTFMSSTEEIVRNWLWSRTIWLFSILSPPPPVSKLYRRETGILKQLADGRGCGWGRSQIIRRESLVLYKSFNAFWVATTEVRTAGHRSNLHTPTEGHQSGYIVRTVISSTFTVLSSTFFLPKSKPYIALVNFRKKIDSFFSFDFC